MMSSIISRDELSSLILENVYIKNSSSNKKKDQSSLSYLIERDLSQSDCIKLGNGVEKLLQDLISKYSVGICNIKPKNSKGAKEKDHLFCDEEKKIIYYAELKANINLDTEKSKSTYMKCLDIVKDLKTKYPGYEIKWCLLGYRYINYSDIPPIIQKKYSAIGANLFGINQYLSLLNVNLQFSEAMYKTFLNEIADAMFSD